MQASDVLQLVACVCTYLAFKWLQRWVKAKVSGAVTGTAATGADADAAPAAPSLFGKAWNKIAAADAALVEYLARDPPPGHKRKV